MCPPTLGSLERPKLSAPPGAPHGSPLWHREKELSKASSLFLSSAGTQPRPATLAPARPPAAFMEVP